MKLGIIGLPNVGKSTLFNAITNSGAAAANYPFCTIEPNIGIVPVPDARLRVLTKMFNPKKTTPASVEFVDIAGLVRGASKGEGLGNKFLSNIRAVDAIVHVVRCFENDDIAHVEGSIDPARDIEVINIELILSDIEMLDRRIEKTAKLLKGDKTLGSEYELLLRLKGELEQGKPAKVVEMTPEQLEIIKKVDLLTLKPVIYVANMSENDFASNVENNPYYKKVQQIAAATASEALPICAEFEAQISDMSAEEKQSFLADLGLKQSGLDRLIVACYRLLGLISFLTAGPEEVRAWTIPAGTKAPAAAGKIHSDMQRGFIRAEVISYDDLIKAGSMAGARESGLLRIEGKEYEIKDGDVVHFRFNV